MKLYSLDDTPYTPVSHDPSLKKRVLVDRGELPAIGGLSHIVLPAGAKASVHAHPEGYEVFYCVGGEAFFRIGGKDVALRQGHCLVVEPGEAHSIEDALEGTELVYFFLERPPA